MTFPNLQEGGAYDWNRYINIYKNLMRDIKRFYNDKLKLYIDSHRLKIKNKALKTQLLPVYMKLFVDDFFDSNLLKFISDDKF